MSMLRQNLQALARRDPELVTRIGWPVDGGHVTTDAAGALEYHFHQTRHRLALTPEALAASLGGLPDGDVLVFGLGLGEQTQALLAARPLATVTVWDRDPWLLRLALDRHDWTDALASGRLRLLLGTDLVAVLTGRLTPPLPAPLERRTLLHPLLAAVYQDEGWLLAPGLAARPMVALAAGGLFADDLASALRDQGHAVFTLDIHRLSQEELTRAVRALAPAFIAAINYTEGLAEFAAGCGCPLLVWEIDPATSALPACRVPTDGAHIFTYRRANVAEFQAAGFVHVMYLPLAANPQRRAPIALSAEDRRRYGAPVAFVGSSLAPQAQGFRQAFVAAFNRAVAEAGLAGRAADQALEATSVMNDVLDVQRLDFSRYVVPAALAQRCPDLLRRAPGRLAELARLLAELAAADKRAAAVARLIPHGIAVWGDDGWRATPAIAPQHRGPAGHSVELTKIYNASLINLDIGRLYQDDIVTMRVFDVLACGGFVLAETSEALADLFDVGVEVDCYRTFDEMEGKVAHYLAHPQEAHAIAARGQQAVLSRHTIAERVRTMRQALR